MYPGVNFLCVQETLASGRDAVFVFDSRGAPMVLADTLVPPIQPNDPQMAWHSSGVAIASRDTSSGAIHSDTADVLQMAQWTGKTYQYMRPLLGRWSVPLSSASVFLEAVRACLKRFPRSSSGLEVGGDAVSVSLRRGGYIRTVSVDPAYDSSASAGRNERAAVPRIEGVAEALPFESESMDFVVCLFALEHLIEPNLALSEMGRVLRAGGVLLLGIPVDSEPTGRPAFLHRWRFCWSGNSVSHRTMPLAALNMARAGLQSLDAPQWQPIATYGSAHLFSFGKVGHAA